VLIATGNKDIIAGDPRPLAGWFRDARVMLLEGGEHTTLPADPRFHQAVEDFLATVSEGGAPSYQMISRQHHSLSQLFWGRAGWGSRRFKISVGTASVCSSKN